jgi:hypothetical protein
MAANKRKAEVFTAGRSACDETVALVEGLVCDRCEIEVPDMRQLDVSERAKGYGIRSVLAVVIDGSLADCCAGRGPDAGTLRAAGLGQAA